MKISVSARIVRDIIPDMSAVISKFPLLMIKLVEANKKYQKSNYPEYNFEVKAIAER
jgi:hypothetical protein